MTEPADLFLLRREVALEKRRLELARENAIFFFKPHTKQRLFFENANFRFRYARTGNRFGKSEMGAAEDIAFALGYRPWIAEGDPLRTLGIPPHPTKGLIITTDWDKTKEVFTEKEGENRGKLIKYIPKDAYLGDAKNHSGQIDLIKVRHVSGGVSTIALDTTVSYKQNPLGQESSSWDWVHVDEPIPEGMWKAVARGLVDRGGRAWFTCTPISEPWIDAAFIPDLSDQTKVDLGEISSSHSRWMMTGEMDDNPHNTPEFIADYMSWLTDDEKEARRKGIPLSYAGIVYKEFSWASHVLSELPAGWQDWTTPPSDHCIYIANDYHFRKNNANLFIAVPPDGPAIVFHEIWEQLLVEEEVAEIKSVLRGRAYQPIIMDPLASTPNKVNDLTAMDEYRMRGLAVLPATKDPVNGIRAVKALLKARGKDGRPALLFAPHLKRTLFEIARGFIWDGEANKPVKNNDDMMECLYRLVLQGLTYIEPASDDDFVAPPVRDIASNVLSFPDFSPFAESDREEKTRAYASRYRA